MSHTDKCFRSDGDWFCAPSCTDDRDQRDEAIARAERAEAACAQMRYHLECVNSIVDPDQYGKTLFSGLQQRDIHSETDTALATDIGSGYVDPQTHAAVVNDCIRWKTMAGVLTKERDEAEARERHHHNASLGWTERCKEAETQLAECQAQAAVMREALERVLTLEPKHEYGPMEHCPCVECCVTQALASDAGKRLADRVKLLEAVAEDAQVLLANDDAGSDDWGDIADSLAALDAHDKQHGG